MGQETWSSGLDPLGNRAVAKHGDKKLLEIRRGIINKPVSILHGHCPLQLCDAKTLEFIGSAKPIEDNYKIEAVAADSKVLDLVKLLQTRLDHLVASKRPKWIIVETVAEQSLLMVILGKDNLVGRDEIGQVKSL